MPSPTRVPGLRIGHFDLTKRLPVAAGLGGGSSDAAAALRLLARANRICAGRSAPDGRPHAVTGADVPVCLDPRPRVMRGIGDVLSDPLDLPRLPAVLVNPGVAVPTKDVFAALRLRTEAWSQAPPLPPPLWEGGGARWQYVAGPPPPTPPRKGEGSAPPLWRQLRIKQRSGGAGDQPSAGDR